MNGNECGKSNIMRSQNTYPTAVYDRSKTAVEYGIFPLFE